MDELKILVDHEMPHVIQINETNIDSSISDTNIQIEGYRLYAGTETNGGFLNHEL